MGRKKKRWPYASFVAIPRNWLHGKSPEWSQLSARAKLFYLYLKAGYNLANNGHIILPYSRIKNQRGLSSPKAISRAIKELEEKEFIERTKKGGLFHGSNEYLLSGKHDPYL